MKITANKYVAVTYDLNVGDGDERELMEKATDGLTATMMTMEEWLKALSMIR